MGKLLTAYRDLKKANESVNVKFAAFQAAINAKPKDPQKWLSQQVEARKELVSAANDASTKVNSYNKVLDELVKQRGPQLKTNKKAMSALKKMRTTWLNTKNMISAAFLLLSKHQLRPV